MVMGFVRIGIYGSSERWCWAYERLGYTSAWVWCERMGFVRALVGRTNRSSVAELHVSVAASRLREMKKYGDPVGLWYVRVIGAPFCFGVREQTLLVVCIGRRRWEGGIRRGFPALSRSL